MNSRNIKQSDLASSITEDLKKVKRAESANSNHNNPYQDIPTNSRQQIEQASMQHTPESRLAESRT